VVSGQTDVGPRPSPRLAQVLVSPRGFPLQWKNSVRLMPTLPAEGRDTWAGC